MKIVVIGGRGLIGSKVATKLGAQGHDVIAASRRSGVDSLTGEGLAGAVAGADVVVDVADSPLFDDEPVMHFFTTATTNLLSAEQEAGVKHHVALSVVGAQIMRSPWPLSTTRCRSPRYTSGLVVAHIAAGAHVQAIAAANELIDRADTIVNPWALSYALLAYGMASCDADPLRARDALRRGLAMAQDSGNRTNVSHLANVLGRLEARHGDPLAALEHLALAIRNYHDSGNTTVVRVPLAALAALLDRLGRCEPAATIAGHAFNPVTRPWLPELGAGITHLRDVLGDQTYESLAGKGETMTTAEIVTFAYDQIDQARAGLTGVSK
jgi:NAD(P)-dependent dehydrogenase (short-subunit alcohol dehydrogenase family)